jgi:hypothetical protein
MQKVRLSVVLLMSLILVPFIANKAYNALALDEAEADAKAAIADAQEVVINCYEAALDAEESRATITQLISVINEAGTYLSKAYLAYSEGNFSSAVYFANLTRISLDGFADWAYTLKENGIRQSNQDFMINIVGSIFGSIAILCGGFAMFFLLKRKYGRIEGVAT